MNELIAVSVSCLCFVLSRQSSRCGVALPQECVQITSKNAFTFVPDKQIAAIVGFSIVSCARCSIYAWSEIQLNKASNEVSTFNSEPQKWKGSFLSSKILLATPILKRHFNRTETM
jgi:hypothetical protein